MAESLQTRLEREAIAAGSGRKAQTPIANAIAGKNAGMVGPLAVGDRVYYVNDTLNAAGWTNSRTGNTFVTPAGDMANTAAHEGFHQRQVPAGGMPPPRQTPQSIVLEPEREALARNMEALQPAEDFGLWGNDPNRSAEEQIANIAGYEGALPAGTPITKSPIADKLFAPGMVPAQAMKNYYFHNSSLPNSGVWEGQVPETNILNELYYAAAKKLRGFALSAGMNTGRSK